jgi:hypothetical protein
MSPARNATELSVRDIAATDDGMFSFFFRYDPYVMSVPMPSESEKNACFKPSKSV